MFNVCPGFSKYPLFTVRGDSILTEPCNKVVTTLSSSSRARTLNFVPNTQVLICRAD